MEKVVSDIKKINIPLSENNRNVEVINNRLRIIQDDNELIFSEEDTEFFLFKLQELKDSGKTREDIISYISGYFNFHIYLNSLDEKDRNLLLLSIENYQMN